MCSLLLLNIATIRGNISKDKTTFFSPRHTLRSRFVFATLVSFLKIHRFNILIDTNFKDSTRDIHEKNDFLTFNKSLDF